MQNKVEASHVQNLIDSLTFQFARIGETTTTVCEAFLPNGFSVGSGKSACVDPNNFDYEMGCEYAKENAVSDAKNTIWALEGYLLKTTGRTSDRERASTAGLPAGALMGFGYALCQLKQGNRVSRKGWNGKGIFIELQVPDANSKMSSPYIYIDTTGLQTDNPDAPKSLVPWLASQTDMLAEDWAVI